MQEPETKECGSRDKNAGVIPAERPLVLGWDIASGPSETCYWDNRHSRPLTEEEFKREYFCTFDD